MIALRLAAGEVGVDLDLEQVADDRLAEARGAVATAVDAVFRLRVASGLLHAARTAGDEETIERAGRLVRLQHEQLVGAAAAFGSLVAAPPAAAGSR